ncbi:glycosyltransferase family 2 protein [Mesobacillus boroniphilus]|uniref:Glycosyltransferase family 2 protein n=1 Tax=Mesobacillus boroniphilus TaxID=308892 RepID=A0A944CP53_9BACI|nr:glycosyltransferase family A protein [Mesobacillus boroniphilus]MBS8266569.1 glycosyltransferase family 2 protein [Mesobacillus boroniphilus]
MENRQLKISIIIPTFNREKLVMEAIESLRKQTYENIEIIVIDDCSTDNTQLLIENERLIDPRIVYIRHEQNKGAPTARNTGIESATGEYIAFLDSDDRWLAEKLERQMAVLKENKNAGLVYTGYKNVLGTQIRSEVRPHARGNMLAEVLKKNCLGTTSTVLVKKEILLAAGGFDPELPSCQDWDLYVKLAQMTEFDVVPEPMVLYNEHDGDRITNNVNSVIKGHLVFYQKYHSLIKGLNNRDFHTLHVNMAKVMVRTGIMGQNRKTIKKGRDFLKHAMKAYPYSLKVYLIFIGTLLNNGLLLKMYSMFKRVRFRF